MSLWVCELYCYFRSLFIFLIYFGLFMVQANITFKLICLDLLIQNMFILLYYDYYFAWV